MSKLLIFYGIMKSRARLGGKLLMFCYDKASLPIDMNSRRSNPIRCLIETYSSNVHCFDRMLHVMSGIVFILARPEVVALYQAVMHTYLLSRQKLLLDVKIVSVDWDCVLAGMQK
jgi:hypothetical protein